MLPAISVENISKKYQLGLREKKHQTFREAVMETVTSPLKRFRELSGNGHADSEFWALRDVSFEVREGEVLGIIGRNGAGKSTLLKILSRITEPTSGRAVIHGRVASLLEVGTGFHNELSGRENVYLNGAILGMGKSEIDRKFDEIVDFSGVEKFLDTAIKHYSSGMKVRLAFAVAAHLDPEILIIDEVLAVGDQEFQNKCMGKMHDVAVGGRTVLFVSHNMPAVNTLCDTGVVLRDGQVDFIGPVEECTARYASENSHSDTEWFRDQSDVAPLQFNWAQLELAGRQPSHTLRVSTRLTSNRAHKPGLIAVDILNAHRTVIMQAMPSTSPFIRQATHEHEFDIAISLPALIPGRYYVTLWVGGATNDTLDYVHQVLAFDIVDSPASDRTQPYSLSHGSMLVDSVVTERRLQSSAALLQSQ